MANAPLKEDAKEPDTLTCGVVMPIADFTPYPVGHWSDVFGIVREAVALAGFSAKLVNSEDAAGVLISAEK